MLRFEILLETKGQDHVRKKIITMKLFRLLLMMKRHPNIRKVFRRNKNAKFNEFMVRQCGNLLEADEVLFKARKFLPQFVLAPLCSFLNLNLDRSSLLQLKIEMDATGYPDDHKFFDLVYCGHTQYPHSKIFLDQARALIISQFQ